MPAATFNKSSVVALLDHKKVNVPAVTTVRLMAPLGAAQAVLGVVEVLRVIGVVLLVTVNESVEEQTLPAVTVTE